MAVKQSMLRNGFILAGFALVATAVIALTFAGTKTQIEQQQVAKRLAILNAIIEPATYNNDIQHDCALVTDPESLGTDQPHRVFRARKDGQPVAVAIETTAPSGYSGKIELIVGIDDDAVVTGVRVLEHKETPGLGDKIEIRVSDWIRSFDGKTVTEQNQRQWQVRKDGGQFDQFTGATITPRAVVNAVRTSVLYFKKHSDKLFEMPNACAVESAGSTSEGVG